MNKNGDKIRLEYDLNYCNNHIRLLHRLKSGHCAYAPTLREISVKTGYAVGKGNQLFVLLSPCIP